MHVVYMSSVAPLVGVSRLQLQYGRRYEFAEIRGNLCPLYRDCTNAIFISKGIYGNGEPENVILVTVQKAHLALRTFKYPVSCIAV